MERKAMERHDNVWQSMARQDKAWHDKARQGMIRHDKDLSLDFETLLTDKPTKLYFKQFFACKKKKQLIQEYFVFLRTSGIKDAPDLQI
jgi:hypothetical protein